MEKNLNFAIIPKRIPVKDIVASFEKGFKNVPNQSAVELARSEITQNFELHKITFSKFIARRKESFAGITIGSNHQNYESGQRQLYTTVIMDKKDYDDKIMHLLNDCNVYQILPVGDKTIEITDKKVNKLVYGFAEENKIYNSLAELCFCLHRTNQTGPQI